DAPVHAVAGDETGVAALDGGQEAVAVELDLVDPLVAFGRGGDERGELRLEGARERRPPRPGELARDDRPDAFGARLQDVFLRLRPRDGILPLAQEPLLLLPVVGLLEADEGPASLELRPLEPEAQLAPAVRVDRISFRGPDAAVPEQDCSGAVFPLRNG